MPKPSKVAKNQSQLTSGTIFGVQTFFGSSKNIFDSEIKFQQVISASHSYKEYDFEADGSSVQQQENEQKIQNLWRTIEKTEMEPYRVSKDNKKASVNGFNREEQDALLNVVRRQTYEVGKEHVHKTKDDNSGSASPGLSTDQFPRSPIADLVKVRSQSAKPRSWLEALQELRARGMDKEAENSKHRTCKLCEHSDLGQVFADEAYQDRYIKPTKPYQC